jgi:DivIVA domain-containing protein
MMDLTPLDIRKKKGDFARGLRGYDQQQVDQFLDLVADRLEELVKLNLILRERVDRLDERVQNQEGREHAVQEALVSAQSLKSDIEEQAKREAELILREARVEADRSSDEIGKLIQGRAQELADLGRARARFLRGLRGLLEQGMDLLEEAESGPASEELDLDILQFGRGARADGEPGSTDPVPEAEMAEPAGSEAVEGELEGAPAGAERS